MVKLMCNKCHAVGAAMCPICNDTDMQVEDALATMFEMQRSLQAKLGYDFDSMDTDERKAYLDEYFKHAHQELFEAQLEVPGFKPWKKYSYDADDIGNSYQLAKEELVDVWHFFMNLCLALGMGSQEFYKLYQEKNAENFDRQKREGYKPCVE